MVESSKQYTTFIVGTLGFFQCKHMPFGLCNAPATVQWLMMNCLGELNYSTCLVYLNDVVIFSSTQEEHMDHLCTVLKCFRLCRLKLKPSKCAFFKGKIEYLGHSVSSRGVWPSRDNLKAITKYPEPMKYTTIKGFIRLKGYYRCFIKDFAKIADPLHEYARGDTVKKKERVVLNEAARDAFHKLKKAVMSTPVLAYPNPNKEYLLETDASKLGLGAVLSQKQVDGRYHPVAFSSQALHGAEVNYHSMKLKFLAMKWSIEHFQTYLLGHRFKVHTDNNPLMYFLTSPNIDAMKQRWINKLTKYDFSLEYQKGKNNTVADALSRIKETCLSDEEANRVFQAVPMILGDDTIFEAFEEKEEDQQLEKAVPHTMSPEAMKAVFDNLTSGAGRRAELEYKVDSATHHEADSIEVSIQLMRQSTQMHITHWAEAQCEDPEIEAAWTGVTSIEGNPSHGLNSLLSLSSG